MQLRLPAWLVGPAPLDWVTSLRLDNYNADKQINTQVVKLAQSGITASLLYLWWEAPSDTLNDDCDDGGGGVDDDDENDDDVNDLIL